MRAAIVDGQFIVERLDVRLPIGFFLQPVAALEDNKVTLLS